MATRIPLMGFKSSVARFVTLFGFGAALPVPIIVSLDGSYVTTTDIDGSYVATADLDGSYVTTLDLEGSVS